MAQESAKAGITIDIMNRYPDIREFYFL